MATVTRINVNSDFASAIMVYRTGNVVSVDIDGKIIANARTIFATGLPPTLTNVWIKDLAGRDYRLYPNGSILCTFDLTADSYVNLHFMYISV